MTFAAQILTLYPDMFPGPLGQSIAGRAMEDGKWSLDAIQIRDFATDKHRTVDDTPAGGGAGMVLKCDVLAAAVDAAEARMHQILPEAFPQTDSPDLVEANIKTDSSDLVEANIKTDSPELVEGRVSALRETEKRPLTGSGLSEKISSSGLTGNATAPILAMTPRGKPITQARIRQLAAGPGVTILCGRFEGFDERLFEARPQIEQVSMGDIILSGGEMGALMLLDAIVRLLPGVMGSDMSGEEESFESGLLEYPHYTRPPTWEGLAIPEVLRSGDHAKIARWRREQAEADTRERRPDLWSKYKN